MGATAKRTAAFSSWTAEMMRIQGKMRDPGSSAWTLVWTLAWTPVWTPAWTLV
jgi:hypothetical protein